MAFCLLLSWVAVCLGVMGVCCRELGQVATSLRCVACSTNFNRACAVFPRGLPAASLVSYCLGGSVALM